MHRVSFLLINHDLSLTFKCNISHKSVMAIHEASLFPVFDVFK